MICVAWPGIKNTSFLTEQQISFIVSSQLQTYEFHFFTLLRENLPYAPSLLLFNEEYIKIKTALIQYEQSHAEISIHPILLWEQGISILMGRCCRGHLDIDYIAVSQEHWRRGHGRKLLILCETLAKNNGITDIFLEVSPKNQRAVSLYLGLSYTQIHIRPSYYANGEDALVLQKRMV